ncbi:MAG TPA: LysR family transcriptional regulator [Byssovorax sp.]
MPDPLDDLRLSDVLTFFAVRRSGSVTGAARELGVTPSHVSKAITRLERQLSINLLSRGTQRVTVSEAGLRALPVLEQLVLRLRQLSRGELEHRTLTVAAPSYLLAFAMPLLAIARPDLRLRGSELPQALVRSYAADSLFDVALTQGQGSLPRSFASISVGFVRKALYAPASIAKKLGPPPIAPERVRELSFIAPTYISGGQFLPADDDCPIPMVERRIGHEVTTVALAFQLIEHTEAVVFGPAIAAQRLLAGGALVEIPVKGWDVRDELFVGCDADRVMAGEQRSIVDALKTGLIAAD